MRVTVCLAGVLAAAAMPAAEASAKLLSGTEVALELQQHVTSAYTPVGANIRFRVAEDVIADGQVVIRRGTPVTGRLRQAADTAMAATSGSMTIGVDFVPAVDGQQLRVVATESRQGRDRGNALAGWTILWGLPGLMTRGVHPYLPRGSLMIAQVLFDRRIEIPESSIGEAAARTDRIPTGRMLGHRFSSSRADPFRLDMERERDLGTASFRIEAPAMTVENGQGGWTAALVAVDEIPLVEPTPALGLEPDAMNFDAWSILRYCRDGATALRFRITGPGGENVDFDYSIAVQFADRK